MSCYYKEIDVKTYDEFVIQYKTMNTMIKTFRL